MNLVYSVIKNQADRLNVVILDLGSVGTGLKDCFTISLRVE